jgi:TetR/AcrR family transcriptional repressor of mexJK operon
MAPDVYTFHMAELMATQKAGVDRKQVHARANGRPTRARAAERRRELLDRALEMFLERGFDHTTIRDVAEDVGMTRRTVYAAFADKSELLIATLDNAVEHLAVPPEQLAAVDCGDLRAALLAFARLRHAHTLTPRGLRLERFIHAESFRFAALTQQLHARISEPTIECVANLLRQHAAKGEVRVEDPLWTARAFMSMVVGMPLHAALFGYTLSPEEIDSYTQMSIDLFLDGVRC